jgi:hypothetical protein
LKEFSLSHGKGEPERSPAETCVYAVYTTDSVAEEAQAAFADPAGGMGI